MPPEGGGARRKRGAATSGSAHVAQQRHGAAGVLLGARDPSPAPSPSEAPRTRPGARLPRPGSPGAAWPTPLGPLRGHAGRSATLRNPAVGRTRSRACKPSPLPPEPPRPGGSFPPSPLPKGSASAGQTHPAVPAPRGPVPPAPGHRGRPAPRPAPWAPVGRIGFLGFLSLALEPPLLLSPYSQCWAPAVPVYLPFLEHSELFPTSSQAFALTCLSPP